MVSCCLNAFCISKGGDAEIKTVNQESNKLGGVNERRCNIPSLPIQEKGELASPFHH